VSAQSVSQPGSLSVTVSHCQLHSTAGAGALSFAFVRFRSLCVRFRSLSFVADVATAVVVVIQSFSHSVTPAAVRNRPFVRPSVRPSSLSL